MQLTTYTFNRHHTQRQFCPICGCQPFGLGRMPDGTETAAVNLRYLDGVALEPITRVPINGRAF